MVSGLDDAAAIRAMSVAMNSSCDVSAVAHVPGPLVVSFGLPGRRAATLCRIEGVAPSVEHRKAALTALLQSHGPVDQLGAGPSIALWRNVRDVRPFWAGASDRTLWRVSTAPARSSEVAAALGPDAQWFYDWGGGLIWIAMPPSDDGGAAVVRDALHAGGGHATLIRAPAALRAAVDVFEPQSGALAAVTRRVKEAFDPKGVLNPGRMWAGV
jgi:glycolate oxidase FAD binding subunit